MNEKALPPISQQEVGTVPTLWRWVLRVIDAVPNIRTYSVAFNPASVAANSESVQTIAIAGVETQDIITVNKPTNTAGLDITQAWVSAADVVSVKFRNHTGLPIDPGSETYLIQAVRL